MNLVKLKELHNIIVSIAQEGEVPNKYNDEKCKLTSITVKVRITSLNLHLTENYSGTICRYSSKRSIGEI